MATLKDIAAAANVSSATVCRILNHDPDIRVSLETRLKVLNTAEEMEYTPKKSQKLAEKRKLNIGIIQNYSKRDLVDNPYFLYLINAVEKYCISQDINTIKFMQSDGIYKSTADLTVDGLIAFGKFTDNSIENLAQLTKNIVFMDSSPDEERFCSVMANTYQGAYMVMKYLYNLGHRRIAFIGDGYSAENSKIDELDVRQEAYQVFMKKHQLYDVDLIYSGECFSYSEGCRITQELINSSKELPTAIFVANDSMAIAVQSTLLSNGIRIPEDISLVGFNDLPSSHYIEPSLTTVHISIHAMVECALDIIKKNVEEPWKYPQKIYVSTKLMERESCAPLRK